MCINLKFIAAWYFGYFVCMNGCLALSIPNILLDRVFSLSTSDRARLKQELLQKCRERNVQRSTMEKCIEELKPLSPIKATANSPLLQKKWMLQWTTEKEINFFLDNGISSSGSIYQVIDKTVLENCIPFVRGGSFGVKGELVIPDATGTRTNFIFSEATLDIGKWGVYRFPPVGKGWFETIYLDDSLRIDINSRNDILICMPEV